ncbi:MAG: OmpA family protein [Mucilaginibacter polytrichastri]|nr:OmpA family protein [Mucilaginibacter polytrichastri]
MKAFFTPLFLLLALPYCASAQYLDDYKRLGDKAFSNREYYGAAFYYKKAADGASLSSTVDNPYQQKKNVKVKDTDKALLVYQLGESYRGYENYLEAEPWYYRLLNDYQPELNKYPLAQLWYGVCLRANQRFDESIKQLEQFTSTYKGDKKYLEIANKEIANCRFAIGQYARPLNVDLQKKTGVWNSDGSNYAVVELKGQGFWFTSSRTDEKEKRRLNKLYFVPEGQKTMQQLPIVLKEDAKQTDVEYGTPSLDASGRLLYFTRWNKVGAKSVRVLYFARRNGSGWSQPEVLNNNVNLDGYNAIQPHVTADAKYLFFASDKPGGRGGYDLWVSELRDGQPISSMNLGETVNTDMDEQAPYYDESRKKLIFSSKGFTGMGGFDLMESDGAFLTWAQPRNLGYPINSAKDDLYYSPDPDDPMHVIISSDRESDCCLEVFDLHYKKELPKQYKLDGIVLDCKSQKPLAGAKISVLDSAGKKEEELITDQNGHFEHAYAGVQSHTLLGEKSSYFSKSLAVSGGNDPSNLIVSAQICMEPFVTGKPIVLKDIQYDFNKSTLRDQSKHVLDTLISIMKENPTIHIELASHTDAVGKTTYNQWLSQQRAQACVDYLIEKGIDKERLTAKGYGKERPIAPNRLKNGKDNPAGRQLNRRTEFTVQSQ